MAFRFELKRIDAVSDRISVEVNAGYTGYRLDVKTGSLVHGQLLGLDDDDHVQYSLTDGTRKFTGDVTVQGSVIAESPDGNDKVWMYHDNTNAWFKTDDGEFNFVTDEGDNTHSYVNVKGKGTGHGYLRVYDEDDTHYLVMYTEGNAGYIHTGGTGASDLFLQTYAQARVNLFAEAEEGETRELVIYGFRTGDGKFPLEIGVGVDAANTASFDGVANYFFDGNVIADGSLKARSPDSNDHLWMLHDNTNAWFKTSDGEFCFKTDEGVNTNSYVSVFGKGTAYGVFRAYDENILEWLESYITNGVGYLHTAGGTPGELYVQYEAHAGFQLFGNAASGETQELKIFGFKAADAKRSLEIGVGVDAANTASFDGLSNYWFDGAVDAVSGFKVNGVAGIDGSWVNNEGDTVTFTKGLLIGKETPI